MEETITTGQIGKKYGLIYGLVGLLAAIVPMLLEVQSGMLIVVPTIIAIVIYVLADKEFREANGGYMSFGEGFRINITAAVIAGVIRSLGNYVYVKFIDPGYQERARQLAIDKLREQGMNEEQIEQAMRFGGGGMNQELAIVMGIIWAVLGALVVGSIVAAILKKRGRRNFLR